MAAPMDKPVPPPEPITIRDVVAYLIGLGTGVGAMLLVGKKKDDDE